MHALIFKFTTLIATGSIFVGSFTASFASESPTSMLVVSPKNAKAPALLRAGAKNLYSVKAGDSLERIAKKQGVSQSRISRLNKLKPPYLLRIGQKIVIPKMHTTAQSKKQKKFSEIKKNTGKQSSREKTSKKIPNLEKTSRLNGNTKKSNSRGRLPIATEDSGEMPKLDDARTQNADWQVFPLTVSRWVWPLEGGIFDPYSDRTQGIDIAGKVGRDVNAAAFGQVVHIGQHRINLGKLVIIKHNKIFFSAYGHIQNPQVKEGQWVEAGEKIAEIGNPAYRKAGLHFEIRQNGEAIDPLTQLPKR